MRGAAITTILAAPFWAAVFYAGLIAAAAVLLIESVLALTIGYWLEDTNPDDAYDDTVFGQPADTFEQITKHLDINWPTTEGEK